MISALCAEDVLSFTRPHASGATTYDARSFKALPALRSSKVALPPGEVALPIERRPKCDKLPVPFAQSAQICTNELIVIPGSVCTRG